MPRRPYLLLGRSNSRLLNTLLRSAARCVLFFGGLSAILLPNGAFGGWNEWTQEAPHAAMGEYTEGHWNGDVCLWFCLNLDDDYLYRVNTRDFSSELIPDTRLPWLAAPEQLFQHPTLDSIWFGFMKDLDSSDPDSLFRTTDGGATWQFVIESNYRSAGQMVWLPDHPSTGYFFPYAEDPWKTTDYGETWTRLDLVPMVLGASEIVNPAGFLYFLGTSANVHRLYHLNLADDSFEQAFRFGTNTFSRDWNVDYSNPDRVLVVGDHGQGDNYYILESLDAGATFDTLYEAPDSIYSIGHIVQDRMNFNHWYGLFAASERKLHESFDGGRTWTFTSRLSGVSEVEPEFYAFPGTEGRAMTMSPYFTYRPAMGESFRVIDLAPPDWSRGLPTDIFYSPVTGYIRSNGDLWRSTDSGRNWQPTGGQEEARGDDIFEFIGPASAANLQHILARGLNFAVSTNGAQSFHHVTNTAWWRYDYQNGGGIDWSPENPDEFLIAHYRQDHDSLRIARTTDLGSTWSFTYGALDPPAARVEDVVYYSANPETLLCSGTGSGNLSGGLYYSTTGGASWQRAPGTEGHAARYIWPQRSLGRFFANYGDSAFSRNDGDGVGNWHSCFGNLPYTGQVTQVAFDWDTTEFVYVYVPQQGIWRGTGDGDWEQYCEQPPVPIHQFEISAGWPKTIMALPLIPETGFYLYMKSDSIYDAGRERWRYVPEQRDVTIFPNPTNAMVTIRLVNSVGEATNVRIFNLLGQVVQQAVIVRAGIVNYSVDLRGGEFSSGKYFVAWGGKPKKIPAGRGRPARRRCKTGGPCGSPD
ncbi:T9SS type A sorting domain-containing protein [candidate division KSB1 bacterium]|nr:T9SS type A sorting domain-containing protein [candidate division KSB1 bacterium]